MAAKGRGDRQTRDPGIHSHREAREYVMTDTTTTTRRRRPPAPVSISEQAQQALNAASSLDHVQQPEPDPDGTQGWLRWVETREAPGRAMLSPLMPPQHRLARAKVELDGVPTYVLRPSHVADDSAPPIFIEIHGGSLIMGGGDLAWMMTAGKATDRNGSTWVPDYRMAPLHPYPAALDDCLTVYRHALTERPPSKIVFSGVSAGGNLAAALVLRAKAEGLPMPAALMLLTAGVKTELHVFEAMPHGGFGGHTPEDTELAAEVKRFEEQHLQT